MLQQGKYREALTWTLDTNSSSRETYLQIIVQEIFQSLNRNNNSLSIGIEALMLLFEMQAAPWNLVTKALHTLCAPHRFGHHYRRGSAGEFGVVLAENSMNSAIVGIMREQDNHVKRSIYVPNYQLAYQLLQRLMSGKGIITNKRARIPLDREFHSVLNACVSAGRMDLANRVMTMQRRVLGKRYQSAPITYSIMLKGYGRQGDIAAVDKLMRSVTSNKIKPDTVMLNSAIDAYVRCERMDRARALLKSMVDQSSKNPNVCRPNARSYNTVLKGLATNGDIDEAMRLSLEMASLKLHDSVTANTLVNAAVNAGRFSLAEKLLKSSGEGTFSENANSYQNQGHVEAYTALLDGYAKAGKLEDALGVLQTMKKRNVEPNEITYTCAIGALASAGRITQAEKMIDYMKSNSKVRPTIITYNAFLTGILSQEHQSSEAIPLNDRIDRATEFLAQSTSRNVRPNIVTINLLLDALGRTEPPRMIEARRILSAAEDEGLVPRKSERLYTTLIKGYTNDKDLVGAEDAFISMRKRDVVALNAYIDACCQCGNTTYSLQIFKEYVQGCSDEMNQVTPDVITFSTLISGLATLDSRRAGKKIQELYYEMIARWKIKPDGLLIDTVLSAMTDGGVKGLDSDDIDFTMNVLRDSKTYGCFNSQEYNKKVMVVKSIVVGRFSEVWKDDSIWDRMSMRRESLEEDEFLLKKGWNSMDSSFRMWPDEERKETDSFLDSKGWDSMDSGFRII